MANINRNFGKLIEGAITYAPSVVVLDGRTILNPTAESYAAAGYLPVVNNPAPSDAPAGKHYEFRAYEVIDGEICRAYALVDNPPPPPRRWTRLSIKTALARAQILDAVRQFLSASEIATGYTAWEALTDCDYIEEGFGGSDAWNALLDGAATALGKTRAEIDAFLANIPTEG